MGLPNNIRKDERGRFVSDLNFADEQKDEIVDRYQEGGTSYEIAEDFDTSHTKILQILREEGCEIKSVGCRKGTKPPNYVERDIPSPWSAADPAYVFGVLIGDASIGHRYKNGERGTPEAIILDTPDETFRDELSKAIKSAFGIQTTERPGGKENSIKVAANSVDLGRFYDRFKWRKEFWRVAEQFFDAPEEIKIALCQGKFDSDGSVNRKAIELSSICKQGLEDLQKVVESLGYKTALNGPYEYEEEYWKDEYTLWISNASPKLFRLPRKKAKLLGF